VTQVAKPPTGGRVARRQVTYAGRLVPGLFERETSDGRVVREARHKVYGRHTLDAGTVTDAVREQRKWLAECESGKRQVRRDDISLRELGIEWEPWARSAGSNYRPRTVDLYAHQLDRHVFRILGGETKATAVTPTHLRRLIDQLNAEGHSGSYVHGNLTALSALLRFGVRRGLLESNPTRLLERGDRPSAKRRKEPRYLDRREIDRLLAKLGAEWRPVAAVCAFAGLRISEALALRWQDVDLASSMLHVPGTKTAASKQPVPMTSDLAEELRRHRNHYPGVGDVLAFRTSTGRPQDRHNAARAIRTAGDGAKLNPPGAKRVAPHDLRHSCAGLLLAAGVPAPKVAAILRHADARVTLTVYAGLVESERAALRNDLERALEGGGQP
jgi:integrase